MNENNENIHGGKELNSEELENAAGGYRDYSLTYRCPKCGKIKTVAYDWDFGPHAPYCIKCSVQMDRIR